MEFPLEFSIKAFGRQAEDFEQVVFELVRAHVPEIEPGAVRSRPSSGGAFQSVTVTFTAASRSQLDAIYQDLTAHERVVMVL